MPKPFSPLLYFRRHKRQTLALITGLILSMTVIAFVGAIVTSIQDNVRVTRTNLSRVSLVETLTQRGVPAEKLQALQENSDITAVYPVRQMATMIPLVVGDTPFRVFALPPGHMSDLSRQLDLRLVEGRLPEAENEIVLSARVVTAKRWRLGQEIGSKVDDSENLSGQFRIVGLLANEPLFGFAVTAMAKNWVPDYLVIPKPGRLAAVNAWLDSAIAKPNELRVENRSTADAQMTKSLRTLTVLLGMITLGVTLTGTVVTGLLLYVFVLQRRPEFALYLAMGQRLSRLLGRLVVETGAVLMAGWILGSLLTLALLWSLRTGFFEPHGLVLRLVNPTIIAHTLFGPVFTVLIMLIPYARLLKRFDFISAIEGRE